MQPRLNHTKFEVISSRIFLDLHIHGIDGIDFNRCDKHEMIHACNVLGINGIGGFCPTLLTDSWDSLLTACERWGQFMRDFKKNQGSLLPEAASPLGIHLEGPFLNRDAAGAHPLKHIQTPSKTLFREVYNAASGKVSILTIAPELPNALEVIRQATKMGVRVQIGHTLASHREIESALKAGAQGATHLLNAMHYHHRDLGGLQALFSKTQTTNEIISDTFHVNPTLLWNLFSLFPKKLYAVSDGCAATTSKVTFCRKTERETTPTLGNVYLEKRGHVALVKGTSTIAGGATFLTEHPHLIHKAIPEVSPRHILRLFTPKWHVNFANSNRINLPNSDNKYILFNSKTLAYLGKKS